MTTGQPVPEDMPTRRRSAARDRRHRTRVIKALGGFLREHGAGSAVLEPVGRSGVRLVVVAGDGRWADAVVANAATAESICAELGVQVGQWERELSGRLLVPDTDRRRMVGSGR